MKSDKITSGAQGQAGVLRVASELILRGHLPFFPAYDGKGVDIIVDGTVRIQVKTTLRETEEKKYSGRTWAAGHVMFSLSKTQYAKGRLKTVSRQFVDECDLLILWAIEPDRFWIVPSHVVNGRHSFNIGPVQRMQEFDTEKAKTLRDQGWTFRAIGELLGVSQDTVKQRFYRSPNDMKRKRFTPSIEFRKCEGRWDLIDEYVNLNREANRLVESRQVVPVAAREESLKP